MPIRSAFALALVIAVWPSAGRAEPAPAACVEIIPAQRNAAPAILLDKCSGRTWQLQRLSSRSGTSYVWRPLMRQEAAPASAGGPGGKCFSFDGRTFCE